MSGIYSDPLYEALGLTDTTQARAADQFYGSLPQAAATQGIGQGGYGPYGGFDTEEERDSAYERDLIRQMAQIDPTAPDYDYQIAGFMLGQEDPNVALYPRVKAAAATLAGRSKLLRETAQNNIKEQDSLITQLAENGYSPERFSEITRPDGRIDKAKAYFQLGELKRTNGASGKVDPRALRPNEVEKLFELTLPLNMQPTDEEKKMAWQQATGETRDPEGKEWEVAYEAVRQPRIQQAQAAVKALRALGRNIPDDLLQSVGMQPSVVPAASVQSQSLQSPTSTSTVIEEAATQSPPTVNPSSPNISLGAAASVERDIADQEQVAARQSGVNEQWTNAKNNLESQLLKQFQGDSNRLNQFYRSVLARESAGEGEAEVSYAPDEYDPTLQLPVGERTLREMGVDPSGVPSSIPDSRGLFSGGKVNNEEVLRALVQDRLSNASATATALPRITTQAERDSLPSGARYVAPNGQVMRKQ